MSSASLFPSFRSSIDDDQVNESQFPSLIAAIHGTDVSSHTHPQVVLAYYDICVRYFKHADQISVRQFLSAMVDQRGLRHPNKQVDTVDAFFMPARYNMMFTELYTCD